MEDYKRYKAFFLFTFFYYLVLIFKSSFVINGIRHFSLFDDMMVSMRYAKNFAIGNGLIWNIGGDRVEGFSNFLWTAYMTLLHLLPIPANLTSLFIQLSGAIFLIANLFIIKEVSKIISNNSFFVIWSSIIFTAFYFPLVNWSVVLGTEVSILTFFTSVSILLILKERYSFFPLFLILLLGLLVRLDFLIIVASIILYLLIFRTNHYKRLVVSTLILVIAIGLFIFLQYAYYHDFLPNTYYLKATGYPVLLRIARGLYVTAGIANIFIFLIFLIGSLLWINKKVLLLIFCFMLQVLYNIFVGGDSWEFFGGSNRFVAVVMPIFFIIFFYYISKIQELISKKFIQTGRFKIIIILFLIVSFISLNSGSENTLLQLFLIKDPLVKQDNLSSVEGAYALLNVTKKDAKIAVVWAGTTPYFTNRYFIDLLGKNDYVIAHKQTHLAQDFGKLRQIVSYWPGHMKWDYKYSLEKLKPDVVVRVYPSLDAEPYISGFYVPVNYKGVFFYARKDSNKLFWEKVERLNPQTRF